jgi:hypothetical protein
VSIYVATHVSSSKSIDGIQQNFVVQREPIGLLQAKVTVGSWSEQVPEDRGSMFIRNVCIYL